MYAQQRSLDIGGSLKLRSGCHWKDASSDARPYDDFTPLKRRNPSRSQVPSALRARVSTRKYGFNIVQDGSGNRHLQTGMMLRQHSSQGGARAPGKTTTKSRCGSSDERRAAASRKESFRQRCASAFGRWDRMLSHELTDELSMRAGSSRFKRSTWGFLNGAPPTSISTAEFLAQTPVELFRPSVHWSQGPSNRTLGESGHSSPLFRINVFELFRPK
ncbi:hypothetical protein B0H14DRAFT_2564448 [Mycena olivaceomarginata]|nr:hypothetical protein B0H14DRAFT_2564448 [Mycena olivaceomarginata]